MYDKNMSVDEKRIELQKILAEMDGEEIKSVLQENLDEDVLKKVGNYGGSTGCGWVPGVSGNPSGRPKNQFSFVSQFRKLFARPASEVKPMAERAIDLGLDPKEITVGEVYALSLVDTSLSGRDSVAKELINRIDGRVPHVIQGEESVDTKTSLDTISEDQIRQMLSKKIENGTD